MRAIDGLVNVDFGDQAEQPEYMVRVKEDYFKGGDDFFRSPELEELSRGWTPTASRRRSS